MEGDILMIYTQIGNEIMDHGLNGHKRDDAQILYKYSLTTSYKDTNYYVYLLIIKIIATWYFMFISIKYLRILGNSQGILKK
jgi:hypothetical protein